MTTIRVNPQILKKAQELGLNVSKTCENLLRIYIEGIEQLQNQIKQQTTSKKPFSLSEGSLFPKRESSVVRSPGFEPGSSAWQSGEIDWDAYREWLEKTQQFSSGYARDVYNYSRKYAGCLLKRDLSKLLSIRKTKRTNIVKALANLAKFVGLHDEFIQLMHKYDLEWGGKSNEELVIDRLTKVQNPNEVFDWIKQVKQARMELSDFMDFMAISGLRLVEAVKSYNLTVKLSREGKLSEYYNEEKEALEHFRFKDMFLRKSKKAFVSFVPKDFVERISLNSALPSTDAIQSRVKKAGLKLRFSDIREAHGTFMTKYLKESEINFIHGRVTTSIFMANYFNPMLIADLKQRLFKGIAEIQNKIS